MTVDDLITWLRAVLADIEAHAQKDIWAADQATPGEWRARYGVNLASSWVETDATPVAKFDGVRHEADALLAQRFKPDNVRRRALEQLAEVDAKRRLLDLCEVTGADPAFIATGNGLHPGDDTEFAARTLMLLALPYADRPGYRAEWRP